jgi:hypothetical protein
MPARHPKPRSSSLIRRLFALGREVRYVAVYRKGWLQMRQRPGLAHASAAESDRYEELIVNPTLLKLVVQRGEIDCGSVQFVVIRYGNFFQTVFPVPDGHVSVALETTANPPDFVFRIREMLDTEGRS